MPRSLRPLAAAALLFAIGVGCAPQGRAAPDFTLTADDGGSWNLSDQRGHPVLLTFGFTHCADTCPATLAKLVHLTRALGTAGAGMEIAMVTVDPQRDTPAVMHRFVTRFDRPIVGLSGTPARIAHVEAAYHVWAQRVPGKHPVAHGYDVVHTAVIYAIDGRGNVRAIRNDDDSDAALTGTLRELTN
jgi:protein SCO1/2